MNNSRSAEKHHVVRDTLIVAATILGACAAIVGVGMLADALPAVIVAVVGFVAFCLLAIMVAGREEGRQ